MVMDRPGRKAMLTANQKRIDQLRGELEAALSTRCHLVRMYERERCQSELSELEELRALVINYENGLGK